MHPHVLGEVCVDQDRVEFQPVAVGRVHELEMKAVGVRRSIDRHVLGQARLQRHIGGAETFHARAHHVAVALKLHPHMLLGSP